MVGSFLAKRRHVTCCCGEPAHAQDDHKWVLIYSYSYSHTTAAHPAAGAGAGRRWRVHPKDSPSGTGTGLVAATGESDRYPGLHVAGYLWESLCGG